MGKFATASTLVFNCTFGGILLAGLQNFGIAQIIGPGQRTPWLALPFANNRPLPYARPIGLAEAAKAQSAIGQTTPLPDASIPQATNGTFIEFDVPGSVCQAAFPLCTTPTAINPAGVVTGFYADANAALHGFLRSSGGAFTLFDGLGATCPSFFSTCTFPTGINPQGSITGYYCDAVTCHGFLRGSDGTITTFDPPGSIITSPSAINPGGTIVGGWYDSTFALHAFLRTAEGAFTTFDAPGSVNGTSPSGIAPSGLIAGNYFDANFQSHGFLRTPDGTITTVDPSGSIFTNVVGINAEGTITGSYQDSTFLIHGFLRSKDGTVTTFDLSSFQTNPSSINEAGTVTGNYQGGNSCCGFVRDKNGAVTTFQPPGSNTTPFGGTFPNAINSAGVITGWYIDPSFLGHGFIRIPD